MIYAQEVKYCGLKIVHVHRIPNDVVAKLVGFTVCETGLHPSAGHPHGEAAIFSKEGHR